MTDASKQALNNLSLQNPRPTRKPWSLQDLEEEIRGNLVYWLETQPKNEGHRSLQTGLEDYDAFSGPVPREVLDQIHYSLRAFVDIFGLQAQRASRFSSVSIDDLREDQDEVPF